MKKDYLVYIEDIPQVKPHLQQILTDYES